MWQPASISSAAAIRLCGMSGTLKARLARSGNLFRSRVSVCVVIILLPLLGVPREKFCSCIFASAASASFPKQETDAAQSSNAVVRFGLGGLVQPGGSLWQTFKSIELFATIDSPAGTPRQLAFAFAFLRASSASFRALRSGLSGQNFGRCTFISLQCSHNCFSLKKVYFLPY